MESVYPPPWKVLGTIWHFFTAGTQQSMQDGHVADLETITMNPLLALSRKPAYPCWDQSRLACLPRGWMQCMERSTHSSRMHSTRRLSGSGQPFISPRAALQQSASCPRNWAAAGENTLPPPSAPSRTLS